MSDAARQQDNCRSSVFEKLPPDLRRDLNVAIIEHSPPNFRALWMQFELAKFGVSYYALYRYARRLRDRVNLAEAAGLAAEDDPGLDDAIRKLAARRLFELLLNTDGAELNKEIAALLAAHSRTEKTKLQDRRLADRSRLDWARLEHDRDELRLKSELLQSARNGVQTLFDEAKKRRSSAPDHVNPENPVRSDDPKTLRLSRLEELVAEARTSAAKPDLEIAASCEPLGTIGP